MALSDKPLMLYVIDILLKYEYFGGYYKILKPQNYLVKALFSFPVYPALHVR